MNSTPMVLDVSDLPVREGQTLPDQMIILQDQTARGIDPNRLWLWKWCFDRHLKYHYGRSPWVERGYSPPSYAMLLPKGIAVPKGAWPIYLKDESDVPGALGYHENAFASKVGPSGTHSQRSIDTGGVPFAEVFVKTTEEDGIDPLEVIGHEGDEFLVDPFVVNEDEIRKVKGPNHDFYIVEVGDPVQGRGYDVFAKEGKISGFTLADLAYPRWFGMDQTRPFTSLAEELAGAPELAPFELAPGGYMSIAPESSPSEWSQIYGSDRAKAEHNAHAFAGKDDPTQSSPSAASESASTGTDGTPEAQA